ncbi:peptidase M24, structural domain-containing protein [Panaeolus papilionaceus]|nr:peptidase M24, structural domain-containing protein [Panaeolus papilionaceus]
MDEPDTVRPKVDTTARIDELRHLMAKDNLDYYVIPSEDAHGSEYVAASDKRREFISGFTGSAGQAVVSRNSAYLLTDSRYWIQAQQEVDNNWTLVRVAGINQPQDWIEWIVARSKGTKIGIDARMISHEKATLLNSKLAPLDSKLVYPPQNLIDLVWKDKLPKSTDNVYVHSLEFTGVGADLKLAKVREWIKAQPPAVPSYSMSKPTAAQKHVGTLVTSLSCIAYVLNLIGSDIPYNPLFHAYLFIGTTRAILFVAEGKLVNNQTGTLVKDYLNDLGVEQRPYTDLWPFLHRREWGEGKVLITPQTSYAISLMLTHFRYTIATSPIETMMLIKNETEIDGMRRAYLRDGATFVKFLAWLDAKFPEGCDITEWEAAFKLTEVRNKDKNFMGLAYENTSATGPNAALPRYSPKKATAAIIRKDVPYLNDSGAHYYDGTCKVTRTVHFSQPTPEMCEAYTRVLQGHIAIDSGIFPEGMSGKQLDVLVCQALRKGGLNYNHGTGYVFRAFVTMHEAPHELSSNIALTPGHIVTNETGFYLEGQWGMCIKSALLVKRIKSQGELNGDILLSFERFTCVPIQTCMVMESMLTKEEKQWLKNHNQRCYEKLAPYLKDDKQALKWLKREC